MTLEEIEKICEDIFAEYQTQRLNVNENVADNYILNLPKTKILLKSDILSGQAPTTEKLNSAINEISRVVDRVISKEEVDSMDLLTLGCILCYVRAEYHNTIDLSSNQILINVNDKIIEQLAKKPIQELVLEFQKTLSYLLLAQKEFKSGEVEAQLMINIARLATTYHNTLNPYYYLLGLIAYTNDYKFITPILNDNELEIINKIAGFNISSDLLKSPFSSCANSIREFLYKDSTYPELTDEEFEPVKRVLKVALS